MKAVLMFLLLFNIANASAQESGEFQSVEEELKAYFFAAARINDVVVLTKFIEAGFPVDIANTKGYTALMVATYQGNAEAFDYLITQQADTCASDKRGNTALMAAIFRGEFMLAKKLMSLECDPEHKNNTGMTAAGFAEMFGRDEVLNYLRN